MKRKISIVLAILMVLVALPVYPAAAAEPATAPTAPVGKWTDAGNYDLSWCATLETADNNKTVTVDGKHYYVKGDWTKKQYTIDTPAKLAGLAYLANLAATDCFKGDYFYITADLDLSAHYWEPIAKKGKFRGALVGKKDGVTDKAAVISGMTIDTSNESGVSVGLVGKFGGDWIKNLVLEDASITAKDFTVGSFVGWQDGNLGSSQFNDSSNKQGGYANLTSDAKITLLGGNTGDRWDDVGGIVGVINNTTNDNPTPLITDCRFLGTISAPQGDNVGGILALAQSDKNTVRVENCVVVSDLIEWEKRISILPKAKDTTPAWAELREISTRINVPELMRKRRNSRTP